MNILTMSHLRLIRLLICFIIAVGLLFSPPPVGAQDEGEEEAIVVGPLMGDRAPDIKLKTLDGEEFQLSRWIGKKPFVVIFFATWCKKCMGEIPTIKKIHRQYAGEKLGLVAVNAQFRDTLANSLKYRKQHDLPYTILFDEKGKVADSYMVLGVPMIIMADRLGIIRYRSAAFPAQLDKAIKFIQR